eukprot:TRINITY_DN11224_c0_g1_i1.p1 TRINITY_DN11224_c0_g1~~TRINITY_DN11224_c0_g1_i1.p1  ORF type:complete len:362 (+),score=175.34 TRINITY_DN11224_c0_g1_i1:132-1088(+)
MDALYYDTKHCEKGDLTLDDLAPYFHLPINEASKKLGICATVLKKICRKIGISRWPHRKFKSVDMLIEKVKEEGGDDMAAKLEYLEETREMLIRQPNLDFKSVVPKHIKTARKADISKTSREPRPLSSPVARQTSSIPTTPSRPFFSPILAAVATPSSSSSSTSSSSGSFHDQMMVHSQSFGQSSPDTNSMDHPSSPNHFPSSPTSSAGSESPSYESSTSTAAAPFQQSAFFESRVLPPLGNGNNGSRLSPTNRLSPILSVVDEDLEQAAVLALADMAQMSPFLGPSSSPIRSTSGFSPKHPNLLPPFRLSPSASVLL